MYEKVHDYVLDIPACHTIIDIKRVLAGDSNDHNGLEELKRKSRRSVPDII